MRDWIKARDAQCTGMWYRPELKILFTGFRSHHPAEDSIIELADDFDVKAALSQELMGAEQVCELFAFAFVLPKGDRVTTMS